MWLLPDFYKVDLSIPHGQDGFLIAPKAKVDTLQNFIKLNQVFLLVNSLEIRMLSKIAPTPSANTNGNSAKRRQSLK